MNSKKEAFKLIIENIQMFDEACQLIDKEISKQIFEKIEDVIRMNSQYSGRFNFINNKDFKFYPEKWLNSTQNKEDPQNSYAHYYFGFLSAESNNNVGTCLSITPLFSHKQDSMVFGFYSYIKCSAKDWKNFIKEMNEEYPQLNQLGFKWNPKEGSFYIIIPPLDKQKIIESYPDFDDAFEPIENALDILIEAKPIFDEIIEKAKTRFGVLNTNE
ncbi:Uncharacterised protein [Canicola haemoglobinophilus]|uniref:Uncharacterized protein n=1 Tax=Canicola haemoglobinophilus TaxID=733 RepID=A0AB38H969_9PAST|nr:hypothetical protein [Canicola haemoglobinophilus]STO53655.1 Uncharacterised protein [Canicola haemoglobinophilus]STO68189.1 Uncharacterised protein [Canicola haemoglobinophilus]